MAENLTSDQLTDLSMWAMKTPFMAKHYSPRLNDRERRVLLLRYGWDNCSIRECEKCWELIPTHTFTEWMTSSNSNGFWVRPTREERMAMHQDTDADAEGGFIDPFTQPVRVTTTVTRITSPGPSDVGCFLPVTVEDILRQDTHQKAWTTKPHTLKEIGAELGGISGTRVAQIEAKAIRKNRHYLNQLWKKFTTMVEAADVAE